MNQNLKVLMIEDLQEDAELTILALQNGGYDIIYERVETLKDMKHALASKQWDCIISDYSLPHFNGFEALKEFKKTDLEIPFLFVSGTMGEDVAVEAMKAGAHDYIVKGRLSRLIPALERELKESDLRRQKKRTEEALGKSEENFRILFEQASDAIFIVNGDGYFINANSSGCRMLGYKKEEILKMNIVDIEVSDPESIPLRIGELTKGNMLLFETILRKKDNSILDVEINAKMLPDGRLQGIVRDITERKRTLEENALLAHSLKSINECVSITDLEDNLIFVNKAFLKVYDYSENEIIGKNINIVRSSNNPPDVVNEILPSTLKRDWSGEIWNRRKDGTEFLISLHTTAVKDGYGRPIALIGVAEDITVQKRMVDEIRENEQRLRIALSIMDIAVFNQDSNLVYTWMYQSQLGYTPDQVIGKTDAELLPFHAAEKITQIKQSVIDRNKGDRQEVYITWKAKTYTFDLIVEPLHNSVGQIIGITGASLNISERKRADEALLESERKFRSLFERSSDAMLLLDGDKFIDCNQATLEMMHCKNKNQLLARHPSELSPEAQPDGRLSREKADEIIRNAFQEGAHRFEWIHRRIDGKDFPVEVVLTSVPLGKRQILFTIWRDITDRKKAEQKIITSELQFRSVWENSFDAMRLCDENGIIIKVNPAFCLLMNKTREELEGLPFDAIYIHEENDNQIDRYKFNFKSRTVKPKMEVEVNLWDKRKVWAELSNSYVEIIGQPILLLSIFRDITDRMQSIFDLNSAKEKAEEMSRLKSSFLANMSHELRTPLIGIMGYADILKGELNNSDLFEMADTIYSSGSRLLETLNLILDLSRIEADRLPMDYKIFNAIESISQSIALFKVVADKKGLYLKLDTISAKLDVSLDERMFNEIINNLVNNAVKYTNKGGITITLTKDGNAESQWIKIKVIDTGIGIPKDSQEYIFDEFRQVSEGFSRSFEGTGLGLTMTKRFVEKLNGKISLESEPGKGTTFIIELPINLPVGNNNLQLITSEKYGNKEVIKSNIPESLMIEKELAKILLVENDNIAVKVTKLYLRNIFILDSVTNGIEAIKAVKLKSYSAILMDINLGTGMSGLQAAQQIRMISKYKDVPIIAFTAFAMHGDKEEFLASGCTHYLTKPFSKEQLIDTINEALNVK